MLIVGLSLGAAVGLLLTVGLADGLAEGIVLMVGLSLGAAVGWVLTVGPLEIEGPKLPSMLGMLETDGDADGWSVGDAEGRAVGLALGIFDVEGESVGR